MYTSAKGWTVQEFVREMRQRAGYSQRDLALLCVGYVSHWQIQEWEKGRTVKAHVNQLRMIARVCGANLDSFFPEISRARQVLRDYYGRTSGFSNTTFKRRQGKQLSLNRDARVHGVSVDDERILTPERCHTTCETYNAWHNTLSYKHFKKAHRVYQTIFGPVPPSEFDLRATNLLEIYPKLYTCHTENYRAEFDMVNEEYRIYFRDHEEPSVRHPFKWKPECPNTIKYLSQNEMKRGIRIS